MKDGHLHFPYIERSPSMPAYETSKHPDKTVRLTCYAIFVLVTIALLASLKTFGHEVWLTRLIEYAFVVAFGFALVQLIIYRRHKRLYRRSGGYIELGDQNLFWFNDRDPEDTRIV